MSFASEFKEFAVKGNVVDLAVGVIIGAAFGKIVDSLVNDLVMPVIAWGNFINIVFNFVILALVVFIMVKQINRVRREAPKAPAAPPEDVILLREIRDTLARQK